MTFGECLNQTLFSSLRRSRKRRLEARTTARLESKSPQRPDHPAENDRRHEVGKD